MTSSPTPEPVPMISVAIGRWAVAAAPSVLRTLLGSCVAVILYDRSARVGGMAHILLPHSKGRADGPGKYADSAIPALLADLVALRGGPGTAGLKAMVVGGAAMFRPSSSGDIGRQNLEAAEVILRGLGIPVVARETGGTTGRNVTLDTASGAVLVRIPGGPTFDLMAGPARPDPH